MKEEQALLVQQKNIMDAAGIEPVTSRWNTSTQVTKAQGLLDIEGMILPFEWTC
jgi:hypothetical protein